MRIAKRIAPFVVLVVLAAPVAGQGAAPWTLDFENDTPKHIAVAGVEGHTHYWYMVYRVKNPGDEPRQLQLTITMELQLAESKTTYPDVYAPAAELYVEDKKVERKLLNWHDLRREPLAPGKQVEAVALFCTGARSPDFDKMTVRVRGLVQPRELGREDPASNIRKFRFRDLLVRYDYIPSRWSAGKELKYLSEDWQLVEVERGGTGAADTDEDISERIKAIQKRIEEERKRAPVEKKPARKTTAAPLGGGGSVGKPNPKLVAALHTAADAHQSVRASYTEIIGREPAAQAAGGTILVGGKGTFAIERVVNVGTERSLKERRVYDGKRLWTHIATREMGDIVKCWRVEATKKEWSSLPGRSDVTFGTVVNPLSTWRLFGDDLAYMGIEKLESGTAYVLDISPGDTYRAILAGPLSGELLSKALGRRVRFWVDSKTGIQLRMRIYDDAYRVVGSIECLDFELDAHTDASHYAYTPPAGVKVIDMTSALADGGADKPTP
jgi:outer membrane lipoprotein-sorting protein